MDNLIILSTEKRDFPSSSKFLAKSYRYLEDRYHLINYNLFILPKVKKYLYLGNTKIVAADQETEIILKKEKIFFSPFNDYLTESEYLGYEQKALRFLKYLPKIVPEIDPQYCGLSLWTVDKLDIFESFFKSRITNLEMINKILEQEKPKQLILFDSDSKLGMIQKEFFEKTRIIDKTSLLSKIKKKLIRSLMPVAMKTVNSDFIRQIKSKKAESNPKLSPEIAFFASQRGFFYSFSVLNKFKEKLVVLQDEEYQHKINGFHYDSLENYIDNEAKKNLFNFKKELKKDWHKLKRSESFQKSLNYNGIQIYGVLEDLFEYLFGIGYLKSAYYCECFNNFYRLAKPKLMIVMCEDPKSQKVNLSISKNYGVQSLLILHGTIGGRDLYENLLSDKVAVYGKYYRKILTDLGNPKEKSIVTGNPAWDSLNRIKIGEEEIYFRAKIPPGKKFLLLATVHFPLDLRDKLAQATFQAMKRLPDYSLVVKLHPEEKPNFYIELSNRLQLNDQIVIVDDLSLLHPLIKFSELVIIYDSTVGLETILLGKPLIDVNLTSMPYWNDYVKEKVALGVRKEKNLLPAIESILENEKIRKTLEKNRKKYLYDHTYKQDGKAAERIVRIIQNLLKRKPILRLYKK